MCMRKYQRFDYLRLWIMELSLSLQNLRPSLVFKVCHHDFFISSSIGHSISDQIISSLHHLLFNSPWCALYYIVSNHVQRESQESSNTVFVVSESNDIWRIDDSKGSIVLIAWWEINYNPKRFPEPPFVQPRKVSRLPTPRSRRSSSRRPRLSKVQGSCM